MKKIFAIFSVVLSFSAVCAAGMLVKVTAVDAGEGCDNGGIKIEVGTDDNESGVLDEGEVDNTKTQFVCNGQDGADGASTTITVTEGAALCGSLGGITVNVGGSEVPVCNGADGSDALVRTSTFEGKAGDCENGGIKIEAGLDNLTVNGILDDDEVITANTKYVCNGSDGSNGSSSIINVYDEPKGTNCPDNPGVKIEYGVDSNNNGVLDTDEKQTRYVCGGKPGKYQGDDGDKGEPGKDAFSRTSEEPAGENCKNGGIKIEVGTDNNRNLVLDDDEVIAANTKYVCNGERGEQGDKGEAGNTGEAGSTGATGPDGKDGASSLVSVVDEPKGENCVSGGKKISVGLDSNRNGILDEEEIGENNTYYVCNGSDAEESGLTSSSTGCSLDAVDDNGSLIPALFALFVAVCAFFGFKKVRN